MKKKLVEIANKIDKSAKNEQQIDFHEFGYELGVYVDSYDIPKQEDRLKCYWIAKCYQIGSEREYGYRMFFFDNEPVALCKQIEAKDDKEFKWFDEKKAQAIKEYLSTFHKEDLRISLIDINKEYNFYPLDSLNLLK